MHANDVCAPSRPANDISAAMLQFPSHCPGSPLLWLTHGSVQALRHSHIIDLLDVVFHANRFHIVLECATGGDLKDHIRAQVCRHSPASQRPRC